MTGTGATLTWPATWIEDRTARTQAGTPVTPPSEDENLSQIAHSLVQRNSECLRIMEVLAIRLALQMRVHRVEHQARNRPLPVNFREPYPKLQIPPEGEAALQQLAQHTRAQSAHRFLQTTKWNQEKADHPRLPSIGHVASNAATQQNSPHTSTGGNCPQTQHPVAGSDPNRLARAMSCHRQHDGRIPQTDPPKRLQQLHLIIALETHSS